LSGIVVVYNMLKIEDDSGQAGMTFNENFSTSYETIIFDFDFFAFSAFFCGKSDWLPMVHCIP